MSPKLHVFNLKLTFEEHDYYFQIWLIGCERLTLELSYKLLQLDHNCHQTLLDKPVLNLIYKV